MDFKQHEGWETFGTSLGFLISYCLFTAFLYLILYLVDNLPAYNPVRQVILITIAIALTGYIVQRIIK